MKNFLFGVPVVAAFLVGAGGTLLFSKGGPKSLASAIVPVVTCDTSEPICRNRHRGRGYLLVQAERRDEAREAFRTAALAGDERSMFQLGWMYEQAYRAKVGRALANTVAVDEEQIHGVDGLPKGEAFVAMLARHSVGTDPNGPVLADRSLAFLWYAAAANAQFAPAMNNIAAMYQFGVLGRIDRVKAREWYIRAYDQGNPVAAFNLARLRNLDAPELADCRYDGNWLPLVLPAKPEDLVEPIITQTRFRGRELDAGMRDLIRSLAGAVGGAGSPPQVEDPPPGSIRALINDIRYGKPITVFDDETPEEARKVPEWKGFDGSANVVNCEDHQLDPRLRRVERASLAAMGGDEPVSPPPPSREPNRPSVLPKR